MAEALRFNLHAAQEEVFNDPARFKVVVAGRRFGKTYLSAITLILEALKEENDRGQSLQNKETYYVAPTFTQGKSIMWDLLKSLAKTEKEGGLIALAHENTATVTLVNGRRISIKGADRPDSLRGVGLSYCVMDEYAMMKPDVWSKIIAPALADVRGGALFIGTPEGKNHFYDLYQNAISDKAAYKNWAGFTYESLANTTLDPAEISERIAGMSVAEARQEFGASFNGGGGIHLREEWWKYAPRPGNEYNAAEGTYDNGGDYYIAIDLAGFSDAGSLKKGALKIRDEHSIAIVKCSSHGWWVEEIRTGQWDVRRTAHEIVNAYINYSPIKLGIEKGIAKAAVGPYLEDEMKRRQKYFLVHELSHGGNKKQDRIMWALQGRLEKKRLLLNEELDSCGHPSGTSWQRRLIEQANDFPSTLSHDDMIDSLAYIDQLASVVYGETGEQDTLDVLDLVCGF